jgi:hypothetical protein
MDLHDDIGSTLSQVAVLSEVALQRVKGDGRVAALRERIAEISRQLVDSMSDVVWAINPERDSLRDLLQRKRRFATDTLDARNIHLRFNGPTEDLAVRLDAHVRREVFLIFEEGIHVRRSSWRSRTTVSESTPVRKATDWGFVASATSIAAASDVRLDSAPGQGTALRLVVRLRPGPAGRLIRQS